MVPKLQALILTLLLAVANSAFAQKAPPQAEWDKATADITGTDTQLQTAALEKIKGWVKGTNGAGWVSADVWRKWIPALVKASRHQDAYDLATLALAGRPNADGSTPRSAVLRSALPTQLK